MDAKHNQRFDDNAANLLNQTIEDVCREQEAIQEARDNIKALMAQAKAHGLDPALIRTVIAQKSQKDEEIVETRILVDIYRAAVGMQRLGDYETSGPALLDEGALPLPPSR